MKLFSKLNQKMRSGNSELRQQVFKRPQAPRAIMLSRIDHDGDMPGYEPTAIRPNTPQRDPKGDSPKMVLDFLRKAKANKYGGLTAANLAAYLPISLTTVRRALRHLERNKYVVKSNIEKGGSDEYEAIN